MKITKAQLIRTVCFMAVLFLVAWQINKIFIPKWKGGSDTIAQITTFYTQPKNSLDVIFLGASSILCDISPLHLWEAYGITSYTRATPSTAPAIIYGVFKETLRYQQPKVIVLDGITLFTTYDVDKMEPYLRKSIDPLPLSFEKLEMIQYIASHSSNQTASSYLFPLLRFHSSWSSLTAENFDYDSHVNVDRFHGAAVRPLGVPYTIPDGLMTPTTKVKDLDEESINYYVKIFEICKQKGIDVILISLPKVKWNYANHLALQNFASQYGIPYFDYNLPENREAMRLDPAVDFFDSGHLTGFAAIKLTDDFAKFLKANYDLADKRGDPVYSLWEEDLAFYHQYLEDLK